jgi:hypothetical protein
MGDGRHVGFLSEAIHWPAFAAQSQTIRNSERFVHKMNICNYAIQP